MGQRSLTLKFNQFVNLPPHSQNEEGVARGGFDHGDVHKSSGRIFVAHTAAGSIEVIDGNLADHIKTIFCCPEASRVLCAQEQNLVFAAARGSGKVVMINPTSLAIIREIEVGPKPNGLAWDSRRKQLLVADVKDFQARLIDPFSGETLSTVKLVGRPRWCMYDRSRDQFLVNIREPACVVMLKAQSPTSQIAKLPVSVPGPHGLDIDEEASLAFVACDGGAIAELDLKDSPRETRLVSIAGEPDVIWYNSFQHHLYCAIARPGVVDVIDTKTMTLIQEVHTEEEAHTLTFDNTHQRLYIFLPESCRAVIYQESIP